MLVPCSQEAGVEIKRVAESIHIGREGVLCLARRVEMVVHNSVVDTMASLQHIQSAQNAARMPTPRAPGHALLQILVVHWTLVLSTR